MSSGQKKRKRKHRRDEEDEDDEDDDEFFDEEEFVQVAPKNKKAPVPVYCICRRPEGEQAMIACDGGCDEWFHLSCVGLKSDGIVDDKTIFHCPKCSPKKLFTLNGMTVAQYIKSLDDEIVEVAEVKSTLQLIEERKKKAEEDGTIINLE